MTILITRISFLILPFMGSLLIDSGLTRAQSSDSIPTLDSASCYNEMQNAVLYLNDDQYDIARDSLEAFMDNCYAQSFSWQAFPYLDATIIQDSLPAILAFREWLFQALYWNSDPRYYCQDAQDLVSTLSKAGQDRGMIAIERYLVTSGKCPYYDTANIASIWGNLHEVWQDTVRDSLLTPFDSSVPTLRQIGFEALLGPQYAVEHNGIMPSSVLGTVNVTPNPFTQDVAIDYTLNVPATLTVEVFDVLGKNVSILVPSVFTTNGTYSLTLQGSSLPSGTYYVRFSVPESEVQTLKLVKQ